jgi:hypothetical protein
MKQSIFTKNNIFSFNPKKGKWYFWLSLYLFPVIVLLPNDFLNNSLVQIFINTIGQIIPMVAKLQLQIKKFPEMIQTLPFAYAVSWLFILIGFTGVIADIKRTIYSNKEDVINHTYKNKTIFSISIFYIMLLYLLNIMFFGFSEDSNWFYRDTHYVIGAIFAYFLSIFALYYFILITTIHTYIYIFK